MIPPFHFALFITFLTLFRKLLGLQERVPKTFVKGALKRIPKPHREEDNQGGGVITLLTISGVTTQRR
jgi:hypothetical protein